MVTDPLAELVGRGAAIETLRDQMRRLARVAEGRLPSVLLLGETGAGKGLAASLLHRSRPPGTGPFIDINCAAIPDTLLEAELFGFERGAFTDARAAKRGLMETAHRGTLFLDEIGALSDPLQAKLLTAIESRQIRRIGSTRSEAIDVWIIAATSEDLPRAMQAGRFRPELYHRLSTVVLHLPPLRARGDDILLLAEHFLARVAAEHSIAPKQLAPDARQALCQYDWPGNIRELGNVLERAMLLEDGPVVTAAMLGLAGAANAVVPAAPASLRSAAELRDEERRQLVDALNAARGNITRAAARLGIPRNTLRYRLAKLDLGPPAIPRIVDAAPAKPTSSPVPALQWERRRIAALRVEIRGAAGADAWSHASRILEVVIAKIHGFGGRVEEVSPSRVTAAFGLDPAEDAPRRAARAAAAILRDAQRAAVSPADTPPLAIALHAAPVLIGLLGSRVEIEGEAKRALWLCLDRLLAAGIPGTAVASASAATFLERRFELVPAGRDGESGETVYVLTGAERRGLGLWGATTRFVGRQDELSILRQRSALAASGRGQVAAVVGEAGVGKSRLIYELVATHRGEGQHVLETAGVSYGRAMSYLAVIELLKAYFAIQDRDDPGGIRAKVSARVLALDPALEPTLPPLLALLDVPVDDGGWPDVDPAERRRRTLDAVRRLLLREAREQPLLLIFEDLHWIDGETQSLLDSLVDALGTARLLLLVSYRPEYQHPWGSRSYYTQLRLDALSVDRATELLGALLGADSSLAPLTQLLVRRGNPFFLEETVRTLVETRALTGEPGAYRLAQPLRAIQIAPTVETILAARIGRLPAEDRRLLQTASVIGKDVPVALLQAIAEMDDAAVGATLGRLQAGEFLYESHASREAEYTFKHALTHEVAYNEVLPERRRQLHARIVEAIEDLHRGRSSEHVERLAYHAVRARLPERAVPYLQQAGLKAAARSALSDARGWYEQALEQLDTLPADSARLEQAFEIRLDLRPVLTQLGEPRRVLENLRAAESLAVRLNDERRRGQSWALMTGVYSQLGRLDEALAAGERAQQIAGRLGDLPLRILATSYLELPNYYLGNYERVVGLASENMAALPPEWTYEHLGNTAPSSVFDRHWLVMSLAELGRFAEAGAPEARLIALVQSVQHAFTVGLAYFAARMARVLKGAWREALSLVERESAVFRAGNVTLMLPFTVAAHALILTQLDRPGEGLALLEEGEQLLASLAGMGIVSLNSWAYHALGCACLALGRLDEARRFGERLLETTATQPGFAAHALRLLGDIGLRSEAFDPARSDAHYRAALALAEPRGMRPLVAHCHLGLGRLRGRAGDRAGAEEHLTLATRMYREMEMGFSAPPGEGPVRHGS